VTSLIARLAELGAANQRGVLLTFVDGEDAGTKLLWIEGGGGDECSAELAGAADEVVRAGRNRLLVLDRGRVFAEVYGPPPRLFIYGAVDTAQSLCRAAKLVGWTAIVADARPMFATEARIPSADELIVAWPDEAFARVRPDHQTAVVVLTHDDKFDRPALIAALATEAFYIGALGSRRNQERRRARLLEAGADEHELERIHGPCGLDVGAETQEETSISIIGEILAVRAGRQGGPLRGAGQRIHAQVD
jgi:xanthine dehydrogenase accessory factor